MVLKNLFVIISRYGVVGVIAAAIHGIVLLSLFNFFPLWLSNLLAFISASIFSYIGHALFTFREDTGGSYFAKRWLLIQFILNITISGILPLALQKLTNTEITALILIFTPTCLNFFVWRKAAKFRSNRTNQKQSNPQLHADDLGLSKKNNIAIFNLAHLGILNSASLIVNGSDIDDAINTLKNYPKLKIYLHVCLTEGKCIFNQGINHRMVNSNGILKLSFINLLLNSFLPNNSHKKLLKGAIKKEIIAQINLFKKLTGLSEIKIDGHQHIHLIPMVMQILLEISTEYNITWIRTTNEPFINKMSINYLAKIIEQAGILKWGILQLLSSKAKPELKRFNISTNAAFAGVLYTGRMDSKILISSWKKLELKKINRMETNPIILSHPAAELCTINKDYLVDFPISKEFMKSKWRQKEWKCLIQFKEGINSLGHELL